MAPSPDSILPGDERARALLAARPVAEIFCRGELGPHGLGPDIALHFMPACGFGRPSRLDAAGCAFLDELLGTHRRRCERLSTSIPGRTMLSRELIAALRQAFAALPEGLAARAPNTVEWRRDGSLWTAMAVVRERLADPALDAGSAAFPAIASSTGADPAWASSILGPSPSIPRAELFAPGGFVERHRAAGLLEALCARAERGILSERRMPRARPSERARL